MKVTDIFDSNLFDLDANGEIRSYKPKKGLTILYVDPYGDSGMMEKIESIDIEEGERAYVVLPYPADSVEVDLGEDLELYATTSLEKI